jgi:gliding motility-associated-like protein
MLKKSLLDCLTLFRRNKALMLKKRYLSCIIISFLFLFEYSNGHNLISEKFIFRQNIGQWNKNILYNAKSPLSDVNVNFLKEKISFGISKRKQSDTIENPANKRQGYDREALVWNVSFLGMNKNVSVVSAQNHESNSTYFSGNDSYKWKKNIPEFNTICYKDIYNNIDLKYYATETRLKYDYLLHKNSKIEEIKMNFEGIRSMNINSRGELEVIHLWGTLLEEKPYSYQIVNGKKKEVDIRYVLYDDFTFGFKAVGPYDKNEELIIDPGTLIWSTFLGGSTAGTIPNVSNASAVDQNGYIYVIGDCDGAYPTTAGVYQTGYMSSGDAYVTKLSPNGDIIVYSTYLGGSNADYLIGIDVNAAGEVYLTGYTLSSDFPITAGAFQTNSVSPTGTYEAFVAKLDASGSSLIYSTFLGGHGNDFGLSVKADNSGNAYVSGFASSSDFPTVSSFQSVYGGGLNDAFITKLNSSGTALVYSTLLGGGGDDRCHDIVLNSSNEVFVGGETSSTNFPVTAGVFQTNKKGGGGAGTSMDAFITRLNAAGNNLIYSTYLGGGAQDLVYGIAINNLNEAFVSGSTGSAGFPTTQGAFQENYGGGFALGFDAFAARLTSAGDSLIYCTFLGGSYSDFSTAIAINNANEAYITGTTNSTNFPVSIGGYQQKLSGSDDIFISKLNSTGSVLLCGSYMGGKQMENDESHYYFNKVHVIQTGPTDTIVFNAFTKSSTFPVTAGVYKTIYTSGAVNLPVVVKMAACCSAMINVDAITICYGDSVTLVAGGSSSYLWSPSNTLNIDTGSIVTANPTSSTLYVVTGLCGNEDSVIVSVIKPAPDFFADNLSGCLPLTINFINLSQGIICDWNFGDGSSSSVCDSVAHIYKTAGSYSVTLAETDAYGCSDSLNKYTINVYPLPTASFYVYPKTVELTNDPTIYLSDSSNKNINNWLWNFGQVNSVSSVQNPKFTFSDTGSYIIQLVITDINGCKDTAMDNIRVNSGYAFYVSNAFTPNGDGTNDIFIPAMLGIDSDDFQMTVFDRWGNIVFETININNGWNGNVKNSNVKAPEDVYVWKIFITGHTDDEGIIGRVSLIR